jgi:pilus assembly protein Flp/PilA
MKGHLLLLLKSIWKDESGQDTAEYALLLLLIALALIVAIGNFKDAIVKVFNNATDTLNNPNPDPPPAG